MSLLFNRDIPILSGPEARAVLESKGNKIKSRMRLGEAVKRWVYACMLYGDGLETAHNIRIRGLESVTIPGRRTLHWRLPIIREEAKKGGRASKAIRRIQG